VKLELIFLVPLLDLFGFVSTPSVQLHGVALKGKMKIQWKKVKQVAKLE
jgi:hypothetical protein